MSVPMTPMRLGSASAAGFEKCNCSDDIERHLVEVVKGKVLDCDGLSIAKDAVAMSAKVKGECYIAPLGNEFGNKICPLEVVLVKWVEQDDCRARCGVVGRRKEGAK